MTHLTDGVNKIINFFSNIADGLTESRINGLIMTSKKRKSKQAADQALDVSMPDVSRKRLDECPTSGSADCQSATVKTGSDSQSLNSSAFPCTSCHKTFATEVDLKAHLMRHMTQHPFVCLACGKGFKYEHSLNFHIKSYHNNNNNNSNNNNDINCKNVLENEIKPQNSHKSADSSSKRSESDRLNGESHEDNDEETDIEDEHTDDESGINDENHNKSHCLEMGAPPVNVGARSIQIKSEKLLITMLEGIHPVTEQSYTLYKCCLCGFAFPSLEPIIVHLQTSHLNTNKEFTCDKCGANFKWRSELTLHEQLHKAMDQNDRSSAHLSVPSFMQPNLVLMSKELGHHFETNNNSVSDRFPNCDEKPIQSHYRSHKKSYLQSKSVKIKAEPQQHSFDLNAESGSNAVQMSQKFPSAIGDIVETSPGQFKCRFCDKTFDRIFSVHRHERVHTGFKPCICKTCGRGFSEKRNLRHHIIRFHSDGSGRELLKRNRKDKNANNEANKRKVASNLKKTALKILNGSDVTDGTGNNANNYKDKHSEHTDPDSEKADIAREVKEEVELSNDELKESEKKCEEPIDNCITDESGVVADPNVDISSSKRRRKGKPSKKIIVTEEDFSPEESSSLSNGENEDTDLKGENNDSDSGKEESQVNCDINPNDFLETKLRCHGAFFSSYNPR